MSSSTSNKPEKTRSISSKRAVALVLAAAAAFLIASGGLAEQGLDEVNVQGGRAYTAKDKDGAVEHVATIRHHKQFMHLAGKSSSTTSVS